MNHLKWMGHTATIMEIQKALHKNEATCDVFISNREKIFKAHRFILCACSDFFKDMFCGIPENQESTIIVPDIRRDILENILSFIYTGEVVVCSSDLSDFLENINLLRIKSAISFECHLNKLKSGKQTTSVEQVPVQLHKQEPTTDQDNVVVAPCNEKDFEYLEVYSAEDKMETYTIEQIEPVCNEVNNDYILTENAEPSFVLTEEKQECDIKKSSVDDFSEDTSPEQAIDHSQEDFSMDSEPINEKKSKTDAAVTESLQTRSEAFDAAVEAVIQQGLSLQKAATKFNISKTVLWRRLRRNSAYKIDREHPMITQAVERLEKGESLKSISQALKIPISTLHRHKVRLLHEGRLPDHVQVKRRDSKDNLKLRLNKAIVACRQGMSQNHAASVFGVPKSTLWRHYQKILPKLPKSDMIDDTSMSDENSPSGPVESKSEWEIKPGRSFNKGRLGI